MGPRSQAIPNSISSANSTQAQPIETVPMVRASGSSPVRLGEVANAHVQAIVREMLDDFTAWVIHLVQKINLLLSRASGENTLRSHVT